MRKLADGRAAVLDLLPRLLGENAAGKLKPVTLRSACNRN
jgi:hypothetical protein